MRKLSIAFLFLMTTTAFAQSGMRSADLDRIQSASTILAQIMSAPDSKIPDSIMDGAKCIAIVPSMLKASFIFGANYGKGVATCRNANGWSTPVFFKVEGGSFGFQAGGQASDLVLVVRTTDGMQHLLQSKFKLGADASAAAGPVGRDAQAATDLTMRAQILTYSRSRGLFAGVSVSGAVVHQDDSATNAFYGQTWTFYSLLNGQVPVPPDAENFVKTVEYYAPTRRAGAMPPTPTPTPATAPAPTVAPDATPVATPAAAPTPVEPSAAAKPAVDPDVTPAATPTPAPAPSAAAPAAAPVQPATDNPTGNNP
ncbi:MAG TPA: lipid-binding SYLF domain-containing protein [Candidatus Angelobacter sp.]|nr:lipid-binding SYLF domain-containing protein [Candidatus Angelobacter sp.]